MSGSPPARRRVVVGARSAVFAPVRGLGLICVDEEHDASYKQESDPRYDARTVAAKRATLEGAVAVFGSATPRPESWAALERLELGGRLGGKLPPVRVVDLRRERGYPLSTPLLAELGKIAERGGKAILLLNRRGLDARASTAARAASPVAARTATSRSSFTPAVTSVATTAATPSPRPSSVPSAARPSSPGSAPERNGSSASWRRRCPR